MFSDSIIWPCLSIEQSSTPANVDSAPDQDFHPKHWCILPFTFRWLCSTILLRYLTVSTSIIESIYPDNQRRTLMVSNAAIFEPLWSMTTLSRNPLLPMALLQRSKNHQLGNACRVGYYFNRPFISVWCYKCLTNGFVVTLNLTCLWTWSVNSVAIGHPETSEAI